MDTEKRIEPSPLIDPVTGKLRPMTEEEHRNYVERVVAMLNRIGEITDETDDDEEGWAEFRRYIEAS